MSFCFFRHAVFALWVVATVGSVAHGQSSIESGGGIAVEGFGQVKAKPNELVIDLTISGTGPKTSDALVKFKESRRRVREAFDKLGIRQLRLEKTGVLIDRTYSESQMRKLRRGDDVIQSRAQITVTGSLRLTLDGIDKLTEEEMIKITGTLLDVAKDVNAKMGGLESQITQMMRSHGYWDPADDDGEGPRFVLSRFKKIREQAYVRAIADARKRAERLAKLNQVQLGRVIAVKEVSVSGDSGYSYSGYRTTEAERFRIVAANSSDINVIVQLAVRFAIVPLTDSKP